MVESIPKKFSFNEFSQDDNGTLSIGCLTGIPNINSPQPPGDISTWFLGTRAENGAEFKELIAKAVDHIIQYRQEYLAGDPETITSQVKASPEYQGGMSALRDAYDKLLEYLREYSTPYFSMRYQGHVLRNTTLPGMLGYFATMLHNPNQLTIQMSTATTLLELQVGQDFCAMVGFESNNQIEPWSHITAGGSIAIMEAVWATRELKFFPFAAREALKIEPALFKACNIEVPIADGSHVKLLEATSWQLFNIRQDDILALPQRIWEVCGESEELQDVYSVWDLLLKRSLNGRGWSAMSRTCFQDVGDLKMITSSTKHYSWSKAMAALGMGTDNEIDLYVDADARMDMQKLDEALQECLDSRNPVLLTAVVLGSVEESAVDPLESVLELRETYRKKGLEFNIHVDAAWGGYLMSMIRRDYKLGEESSPLFIDDLGRVPCNEHTLRQLQRMKDCDSATIDSHKLGYIPYTAGSNLYRNGELKNLTTFAGSYIGGTQSIRPQEPSVAIYGLEGSKPGARAAAVFLSHQVIRPSVSGYGKIISQSLFNTKLFCLRLLWMATEQDNFIMVPLPRLPIEREDSNGDKKSYLATLRDRLHGKTQDEILADAEAMAIFREIGCDQNLLCYAFNFKRKDGSINDDPELFFKLTDLIYDRFHVHYYQEGLAEDIHKYRFFLTRTIFQKSDYGPTFIENYAKRLGLSKTPDSLKVLRSIVMDPYVSDLPDGGSFFDEIIETLRSNVTEIIEQNFR